MSFPLLSLVALGALVAAQNDTASSGPSVPATTTAPPPASVSSVSSVSSVPSVSSVASVSSVSSASSVSSGNPATTSPPPTPVSVKAAKGGSPAYPTLASDAGPSIPNTAPLPVLTDLVFYSVPGGTTHPTVPVHGAWYSYSQPPIPATTTTYNPATFTAAFSNDDIAAPPTERVYDFTMHYAAGWPSGYLRRMAVINNQFPGPLIEANKGDTIVVHVHNNLDHPQSIHWHGIRQNGSNVMDGVPGFSQCAIPPGTSFTYRFQVPVETGTFWYHSHYGNTLADGLAGGLIVHAADDALKRGVDYDDDRVLYLGDWMNDQSEVIIHEEANMFKPYRGIPFVAQPDAALINGIGQCDCYWAQRGVPCGINPHAEVRAEKGKRVRLRLINHGGQALIRFSIDGHSLTVVEADDTAVEPVTMNEVPVGSGQRYSVIVTLNEGEVGDSFWMRAQVGTWCINPISKVNGLGILRYTDQAGNSGATADVPNTQPHGDLKNSQFERCKDLDQYVTLVPRVRENAPARASQSFAFHSLFGIFREPVLKTPMIGFGMNGVMYKNMINDPLLTRLFQGRPIPQFNGEVAAVTFEGDGSMAADIILNVLDPPPIGHPFHLHGRPFYIIARGAGALSTLALPFISKKLTNPLRRDTLIIPEWSYAVIRVKLDNPGVWPLHCHIGWHLASGKMAAVTIRSDSVRTQNQPADWKALCDGTDPNEIGPGRRAYPPMSRAVLEG